MPPKRTLGQRRQTHSGRFFAQETPEKTSQKTLKKTLEHSTNNKSEAQENRSSMILNEFSRQEIITALKKKLIRLEKENHIAEFNRKIEQQQTQRRERTISTEQSQTPQLMMTGALPPDQSMMTEVLSLNQSQRLFYQTPAMKLPKPDFYHEKSMSKCIQWFDHIKNLLDTSESQEFGEDEQISWAVNYLRDILTTNWFTDKRSGKSMPKTWEFFRQWCRNQMKHLSNQEVEAVFKYHAVKQREEQLVKVFFSYLQQMKADLISILNEEYWVHIILNKLLSGLQLKLRWLQTFLKTMIQLWSETFRLEFILNQQKFRRKNQKKTK